jgi:hypothetical protein
MKIKLKHIFSILLLVFSHQLFAQGDEVQLIGVGNRKVEPAFRITRDPKILDTTITTKTRDYPYFVLQYPTTIATEPIKAINIKTESKLNPLYSTYVKLGIGSELMPLGELYFDSKRSRKFVYGIHAKHLSSFGNFEGYAPAQFDRSKFNAYGTIHEKKYTLNSGLYYHNQGLHYYGWKIPTDSIDKNENTQRYQTIGGDFSFASHIKDTAKLNYTLGVKYQHFSSKKPEEDTLSSWRGRENTFAFLASGKYRTKRDLFGLNLGVRYNGYLYGQKGDTNAFALDTGLVRNNTLINLNPHISTFLLNNRFKATVGFDLAIDVNEKTRAYVFPLIELNYSFFNNIFIPYLGVRGGIQQTTYSSLVGRNEFLLTNLVLRNENTPMDVYAGFKGTLSKRFSFHVGASFARIKDKALFVTDTVYSPSNKFNVIYDTLEQAMAEGSLVYQLNEKLKIEGQGRYFSYSLLNNAYAWNLPTWQFLIRGHYNLFDKFLIQLDYQMDGGRKTLLYQMEDGAIEENGQFAKDLGLIADVNLGVEYRYSKRISAFIQLNNIASQRYQRWYNYPVQPIQVMGGVTARF